jgi:hypothetical protein
LPNRSTPMSCALPFGEAQLKTSLPVEFFGLSGAL